MDIFSKIIIIVLERLFMILNSERYAFENFIEELCKQAKEIIPEDINVFDRKYIINTVYNFLRVAYYDGLEKTEESFNVEESKTLIQLIGEWIFHKGIDLKRAKIEREYSDKILQNVAFVVYEIAKQAITKNLSQDELIQVVEHHVKKEYEKSLDDLYQNGSINKLIYQNALNQSNIDIMFEENIVGNNKENKNYSIEEFDSKFEHFLFWWLNYALPTLQNIVLIMGLALLILIIILLILGNITKILLFFR